jgi:hypothetical protein
VLIADEKPITVQLDAVRLTLFAVAFALLALLVPVFVADVPTLVDYPNHLARLWLLGGGASSPPLSAMYRVNWNTLTNVGMDYVGQLLIRLHVPFEAAGRILVAVAVTSGPVGGVFVWRAIHGRWHWWCLAFPLLAWGLGLFYGFLNFEIGIGLAIVAAALDPALARRGFVLQTLVRLVLATGLMLVHLFSLPFYAVLLGAMAIGPRFRDLLDPASLRRVSLDLLAIAITAVLPLGLLLLAPSIPGAQTHATAGSVMADFITGFAYARAHWHEKLLNLLLGIRSYSGWVDTLTFAALAVPVAASLWTRRLVLHAGMVLATCLLAALYLVVPFSLAGTAVIDARFALMAAFTAVLAVQPDLPAPLARAAASALLLVSLIRTGDIGWVWFKRDADVQAVARALESVPAGAAVLPLQHVSIGQVGAPPGRYIPGGAATFDHLAALAVPWRHAFVPLLFAARGKQPLEVLPPWTQISEPDGGILTSVHVLDDPDLLARAVPLVHYVAAWRERFDYALVLNADIPDDYGVFTPPAGVELLRDEGFAQLYRIHHQQVP